MQRYVAPQHSWLGFVGYGLDLVALVVFIVVVLGGLSGAAALVALMVVHSVGVVFYLVAVLLNIFIRAPRALDDAAAYAAFPLDQWHFMVELVAHFVLLVVNIIGYLTGAANATAVANVAVALASAPALVSFFYVRPVQTPPPPPQQPLPLPQSNSAYPTLFEHAYKSHARPTKYAVS